jgi:hypothetical protein
VRCRRAVRQLGSPAGREPVKPAEVPLDGGELAALLTERAGSTSSTAVPKVRASPNKHNGGPPSPPAGKVSDVVQCHKKTANVVDLPRIAGEGDHRHDRW